MNYLLTEDEEWRLAQARLALAALALLVDEAGDCQPPAAELAALVALVGAALPTPRLLSADSREVLRAAA